MPVLHMRRNMATLLVWAMAGLFAGVSELPADDSAPSKEAPTPSWLEYKYLVKVLSSATYEEPADSTLNPGNNVAALPQWTMDGQVRLDFNASAGPVSFFIKPRFTSDWQSWDEGTLDGKSDSETENHINEWQLRLSIRDKAFISYGRENLQWGPSALFSPSNPFNQDNGQNNPKRELPGMDFAKLLLVANREWSFSLIANVGEGRANVSRNIDSQYNQFVESVDAQAQQELDYINQQYQQGLQQIAAVDAPFAGRPGPIADVVNAQAASLTSYATQQKNLAVAEVNTTVTQVLQEGKLQKNTYDKTFQNNYAVKADYQSDQKYATLIASYQETDQREDPKRLRLGGYAGWTVSEAVLLYGEATASLRGDELYPVADTNSPFGTRLAKTRDIDDDFEGIGLLGGSYTTEGGKTIVAEYLYNGVGYNGKQADEHYKLRSQAADALSQPEPYSSLGLITLAEAVSPGMRFIRQNYVLLQYQQMQVIGNLGFVMRCTINLDDRSAQVIPILQYGLGDHWQLFAVCDQNVGPKNTEFTSLIARSYQVGFDYTF